MTDQFDKTETVKRKRQISNTQVSIWADLIELLSPSGDYHLGVENYDVTLQKTATLSHSTHQLQEVLR
jgi:hypothetical protein